MPPDPPRGAGGGGREGSGRRLPERRRPSGAGPRYLTDGPRSPAAAPPPLPEAGPGSPPPTIPGDAVRGGEGADEAGALPPHPHPPPRSARARAATLREGARSRCSRARARRPRPCALQRRSPPPSLPVPLRLPPRLVAGPGPGPFCSPPRPPQGRRPRRSPAPAWAPRVASGCPQASLSLFLSRPGALWCRAAGPVRSAPRGPCRRSGLPGETRGSSAALAVCRSAWKSCAGLALCPKGEQNSPQSAGLRSLIGNQAIVCLCKGFQEHQLQISKLYSFCYYYYFSIMFRKNSKYSVTLRTHFQECVE